MGLILRLDKGTELTFAELDGNFTYLEGLISGFVSVQDITWNGFKNLRTLSQLTIGRVYKVTDKSNVLLQAIAPNAYIQLSKNASILTLVAETPYTYVYTYEQLNSTLTPGAKVFPNIFAVDADGNPVAVKVTGITDTQMILTSAVDCTVRISI
jgi:hypothetical protein